MSAIAIATSEAALNIFIDREVFTIFGSWAKVVKEELQSNNKQVAQSQEKLESYA